MSNTITCFYALFLYPRSINYNDKNLLKLADITVYVLYVHLGNARGSEGTVCVLH